MGHGEEVLALRVCGIACFLLRSPHFVGGIGSDSFRLFSPLVFVHDFSKVKPTGTISVVRTILEPVLRNLKIEEMAQERFEDNHSVFFRRRQRLAFSSYLAVCIVEAESKPLDLSALVQQL